ncbi:Hypothetical Protein CGB_L0460C [Cryptococcus gattii WM276]|uniref:Uncharacterized protein n=2 Tax=Cryptococcus gattii TaxID=37769 RepID=E6REK5_CRYGW|nr:Hypothetical Protein CGB_L0460C [Cryptococcus gattii WM276]ADV25142.1 Hypothetical Protein CGB_L0460C [Cryptococcus gattii WM276]KIR76665.1 hypothetical protein I306_06285 [Cryptococcus gattii EJB2]
MLHSISIQSTDFSTKRLRSCLSPARTRQHSPSFLPDSEAAVAITTWKRVKTVRWQEENGCAVTSFHDTYSHEEYDRTPLEPPTSAERDCVLPERGSRCLSGPRECFLGDFSDEEEDIPTSASDFSDSFVIHTPPSTETNSDDGEPRCDVDDEGEMHEGDDGWDECMQRRRMMFTRLCTRENGDRHPEFEGYRSLSATLAQLLKSVGCDDEDDLAQTDGDEEAAEEDDDEAEKKQSRCQSLDIFGLPTLAQGSVTPTGTPSLVSTEESDAEYTIASPGISTPADTLSLNSFGFEFGFGSGSASMQQKAFHSDG